ncbi:MAG: LPS assembly protein LptD, partial [Hyphomicrobiaceae bacterium]|nr:LPS assembly protein LptD [Hyphomicrobiaceae bacterium]
STTVPYYFALSPQYDFLFSPEYLSKQGVLWRGHWRHRLQGGQYEVKGAAIEQNFEDLPAGVRSRDLDGWRGSLETKGAFSLASWWKFGWDVTLESDDSFRRFYKLDNILLTDRINQVYLEGLSGRNYFSARLYQFGGLLLSDTPQSESRVHPVIDHEYIVSDPVLGGELSFRNNLLSLTRDDAVSNRLNESYSHVRSEAKWRRRLTDAIGITYTPYGEVRGDVYYIDNVLDAQTGKIISDETVTRGLATGGATVSWPWVANTRSASHVIEPIGQIYASQSQIDQRRLPNEDARSLIFDDSNLFEPVKFSGSDRVETGTRANVGVQYTFQANSGWYARFLAGQHFHLSGDNAYQNPGVIREVVNGVPTNRFVYSPSSGLETARSDYVLGAYLAPNETFRFLTQSRFDEETLELRREDLYASASYGPISATAIYTFAAADPLLGIQKSQQDITGVVSLKLTDQWSLIGSMRYDLDARNVLTDSVSLRYADDCFVLTTTYQETFLENVAQGIETDRSLMVRFELKHLGSFGYKTSVLDHTFGDDQKPK